MSKPKPKTTSVLHEATATLVSYSPLDDLAGAAAKSGCRVTITIDINPPEAVGASYENSETRRWTRAT